MYVIEHEELFASIRGGKYRFDGDWLASSTLQGIMGRMAAYTGQEVTWEQVLMSQENLHPEAEISWDMKLPIMPLPVPGRYKLV